MKKLTFFKTIAIAVCLIFLVGNGQAQLGIGLRGGDPSGITIKKYNGDKAIELSIGRTHWINGNGWYNKHYNHWYDKHYHSNYTDFDYLSHRTYTPLGIQLHFLKHKSLKSSGDVDLSGLSWYYGAGLFFGFQKYQYDYRYKVDGNPDWVYVERETYVDMDLGIDGVIGLEYTFEEMPVSIFLDASLYMELFDNPFTFNGLGGIGVRYNF